MSNSSNSFNSASTNSNNIDFPNLMKTVGTMLEGMASNEKEKTTFHSLNTILQQIMVPPKSDPIPVVARDTARDATRDTATSTSGENSPQLPSTPKNSPDETYINSQFRDGATGPELAPEQPVEMDFAQLFKHLMPILTASKSSSESTTAAAAPTARMHVPPPPAPPIVPNAEPAVSIATNYDTVRNGSRINKPPEPFAFVNRNNTPPEPFVNYSLSSIKTIIESGNTLALYQILMRANHIMIPQIFDQVVTAGNVDMLELLLTEFPEKCDNNDMLQTTFNNCCQWQTKRHMARIFMEVDWFKMKSKIWFNSNDNAREVLSKRYKYAKPSFVVNLPLSQQLIYLEIVSNELARTNTVPEV